MLPNIAPNNYFCRTPVKYFRKFLDEIFSQNFAEKIFMDRAFLHLLPAALFQEYTKH